MIRVRPSIVLFGDSLTEQAFGLDGNVGWASLLASAYSRRADVLNRGFSGYNTRHALEVLPGVFSAEQDRRSVAAVDVETAGGCPAPSGVLFCTVFFGANDSSLPGGRQHVSLDDFSANIQNIVTSIRDRIDVRDTNSDADECSGNKNVPIILLTPPPVDNAAWEKHCIAQKRDLSPRSNDVTRTYGRAVQDVGRSNRGCHVLDVFDLLGGNDAQGSGSCSYGRHLSDGLHLSVSGSRLVYNGLMDLIRTDLPHLAPMTDGDGKYGSSGVPREEKLWNEMC